jgi:hypothetical protein
MKADGGGMTLKKKTKRAHDAKGDASKRFALPFNFTSNMVSIKSGCWDKAMVDDLSASLIQDVWVLDIYKSLTRWRRARIIDIKPDTVTIKIHFNGWESRWDRYMDLSKRNDYRSIVLKKSVLGNTKSVSTKRNGFKNEIQESLVGGFLNTCQHRKNAQILQESVVTKSAAQATEQAIEAEMTALWALEEAATAAEKTVATAIPYKTMLCRLQSYAPFDTSLSAQIPDEEEEVVVTGEWFCEKSKSGTTIEGTFQNGKPHGQATASWSSGSSYKGCWKSGQKHGFGMQKLYSGDIYEGNFEHGVRHGEGKLAFAEGGDYTGHFKSGKMSGAHYLGSFQHGNFDGKGTLYFCEEPIVGTFRPTRESIRPSCQYWRWREHGGASIIEGRVGR